MIASIVVDGCHDIGVSSSNKIKVGDNVLSIEKEIPFVRYRFNTYSETEYTYIKGMMQKFPFSTHLVEINLSEETRGILEYLTANMDDMAKYIYIDVTDEDVRNGRLSDTVVNLLAGIADLTIDRVQFRDKSTTLDVVAVKNFIKQCRAITKLPVNLFGVCSSPLSFGEYACLTAVKARELMGLYSKVSDVALPSANHECMNCCGCIRYMVISNDIPAPITSKQKSSKKSSSDTVSHKPKAVKQQIPFGSFSL